MKISLSARPEPYAAHVDEYIAEQHRNLVEAYREAEAETERSVWPDRDDAINTVVVFDARSREASQ